MEPDSIVYTDTFSAYNALDINGFHHHRINHSQKFAEQHNHINGIENFWAFAKTRLVRFLGLHNHTFSFHLEECGFRFNHRHEDIYKLLLKMLRENPLC